MRRGMSLLEVLVAVAVLAAIGAPFLANVVMARRTVFSSSHDVRAVSAAGKTMEALLAVPYPRLPVVGPGAVDALEGEDRGVPRGEWDAAFPTEGGERVRLADVLGDPEPEGQTTYVWIETLAPEDLGTEAIVAKEITVSVRYRGSGPDVERRRSYTLRTVTTAPAGEETP